MNKGIPKEFRKFVDRFLISKNRRGFELAFQVKELVDQIGKPQARNIRMLGNSAEVG
jgi:hypothetical protein